MRADSRPAAPRATIIASSSSPRALSTANQSRRCQDRQRSGRQASGAPARGQPRDEGGEGEQPEDRAHGLIVPSDPRRAQAGAGRRACDVPPLAV